MSIPARKSPPPRFKPPMSDEAFVAKQLAECDKLTTMPASDLPVLEAMALAPVSKSVAVVSGESKSVEQARKDSINDLLTSAYVNASKLELTEKEIAALTADFEDGDFYRGAAGNENLIYLSHVSIRNRITKVVGLGKWALIIRRHWTEEFMTLKKEQAVRVYVEAVLMIRGCYVGEAIGDMTYYKSNASQNFGDAFEGAKSAALRRTAKDFGVGLQPWNKDFCESWKQRNPGFNRPAYKK